MSSAQHSFLNLLEKAPKPDIDTALLYLDHAKDVGCSPRHIDHLENYVERAREASASKAAAKKDEDASTGAWSTVREGAKKRDDLVSQAEDKQREQEQGSVDELAKVESLLKATHPTAVEYFTRSFYDPNKCEGNTPGDYISALPITTNEKKPSLRGLFEAAIELIKHDLHGELIDEINEILEDWLGRCEAGVVSAKSILVEACQRKKITAREILAAIAPAELDILEGSDVNEAGPEELAFAHACWTYWDEELTTAATGSAIVKAIEAKRAKQAADEAPKDKAAKNATNGKKPEPATANA